MPVIVRSLSVTPRRVDAQVYDARVEAARILDEARSAASDLLDGARRDAARIREEARAAGREDGLGEARELLVWAAAERARLVASAEPEVVRTALAIAARVLRREAERSGDVAVEMARRALADAAASACVAVRAHPADLDAVREAKDRLEALVPHAGGIAWIADPAVERGGAVVQTETGSIDARLESQLELIERVFTGDRT